MSLTALLLAACTGAPAPVVESEPLPAEPPPGPAATEFLVEPASIGWDGERGAISVEVRLGGAGLPERKDPVYVGVTVITEADEEVDLLVHTLFPGALDQVLQFSAEIPKAPKHVLIGAWSTKVEPCAVDRPGCKEFGFVLDGSLASFPARLYTEGMRQRFLPKDYRVLVMGDPARVSQPAGRFASIFGASVAAEAIQSDPSATAGVWVEASDDLGFAYEVARALGGGNGALDYGTRPDLGAPMLVVLPQ